MASPPQSSAPAALSPLTQTPSQVCEINCASQLQPFTSYIDGLLSAINMKSPEQQGSSARREASGFVKSHMHLAANTMDNISKEDEKFKGDFVSKLPEEARRVVTKAMEGLGHLHWIGLAFSMAAIVLERIEQVSSKNMEQSIDLLEKIIKLAKTLEKLNHRMSSETEKLTEAVHTIVEGAIICCCHIQHGRFFRYLTAAIVEASLQNTCTKIDSLIADLNFMVTMYTRAQLPRCQQQSQNILQIDPVGIEDQAAAVKNMPDLDSNTRGAARAVVKTSLAEYVISKCSSLEGLQLSVICIDDKILQSTKLQEQIIFDVGGKRIDLRDYKEGQRELSNVLENQLCFLLIDNVVDKNHVQEILPRKLYLPFQSRMLITSRENNMRQVVDLECKEYSSIECLPRETARKLLHQIILDGGRYETNEKEKIDAVADACGGVPLLLEVYGKVLRDNRMESAYDEALASLQKREHGAYKEENLSAKLLFVYHKMRDGDTKDAFLDICCFFHGWQGDKVSAIVDEGELVALNIGALLKINGGNQVIVHDVIKVMGIDKAKHNLTHLQSLQDLKMALEENKLPNSLKWLRLISMPDDTTEVPRIGWSIIENMRHLQWFEFQGFNVSEFPAKFVLPKLLSELDFNGCEQLKNLPQQFEHLSALTDLTLDRCKSLREFPKTVGGLYSLKCLSMKGCENLIELPKDLGSLSYLHRLILKDCKNLKTLPENVGNLVSLKEFTISGCKSLAGLPTGFGNLLLLKSLDLSECESFVELPESLGNLCNLSTLYIRGCNSLTTLPNQNLSSLKSFNVIWCSKFVFIPIDFLQIISLKVLELCGCSNLKECPEGFSELPLQKLFLRRCSSLTSLLPNLKLLKYLLIFYCNRLMSLPDGFGCNLTNLEILRVRSCDKFEQVSSDFECLTSLRSLDLSRCPMLEVMTMDKVVRLKNLFFVYIEGSVKLEEKWEQMQKAEDQYSLVVIASKMSEQRRNLCLRAAGGECFYGQCQLVDLNGQCIPSSQFTITHDSIFVITYTNYSPWKFKPQVFQKIVERLTSESSAYPSHL